jgi:osmoprotectant transport system ATP-binding protein
MNASASLTSGSDQAAIEIDHASFRIQGRALLHDLVLSVKQGETLVLLGRSGSGKTTTLKLINRLLLPTAGEVRVNGKRTADWDPIRLRRSIGYVIQDGGLFPHYTVERNIALVPRIENWEKSRVDARVRELLSTVGLGDNFLSRFPNELSGGQRQRVGVARALAADPPILLLDEAFGALDPITRSEMQKEFRTLQQRMKKTVIFVTHDLREALLLGDRIALMEDGRLVVDIAATEFTRSSDPLVRAYVEAFSALPDSKPQSS